MCNTLVSITSLCTDSDDRHYYTIIWSCLLNLHGNTTQNLRSISAGLLNNGEKISLLQHIAQTHTPLRITTGVLGKYCQDY